MNIIVSKDIVKLNENHSENHYGEYNVNECVFEFDEYFDSVPIKKAIFTSQSNNKSFEIDIINNKCTVPHEVLTKVYDTVILGVYGYDVNEETLLVRYSPEPTTFVVHEGSYKEGAEQPEIITPTQYDIYSKALQEGLAEVDKRLDDVEKQGDYASEQGNYAKEQGDYAKEQGTNAKNVAEETEKKAQEGAFDGKSLEFVWEGTKLGVRLEGQEEYQFVDLQGVQGEIGATGEPFKIKKTYASVSEMNADFRNMEFGDYVMIASSVEVEDNAKLYTRGESAWIFISDFSGAMGIRGETGLTPNIKIGEVKTLEAGSQAKVTRSGSNEEPVFNFELPKGDKGDDYVLTEEDKVEIGEMVNTEYEKRIEENEKDIVDLESYLDSLTPKNSASGELVHITDALPLPTFETKTSGNVKQETTTGKNKFNLQEHNQNSDNVIVTKVDENNLIVEVTQAISWGFTQYTIRNLQKNTNYKLLFDIKNSNSAFTDGYILIKNIETGKNLYNSNNAGKVEFNTGDGTDFYFRFNATRGTALTNKAEYSNIMLCLASEDDTYEPYTNGASPNPEYPQEIEVLEGYNLLPKTTKTNQTINGIDFVINKDGSITANGIATASATLYLGNGPTLPKGDYVISSGLNGVSNVRFGVEIGTNYYNTNSSRNVTFTEEVTIKSTYYQIDKGITVNNLTLYPMIMKGTENKPYLPYGCVGYKVNGKNLLNLNTTPIYVSGASSTFNEPNITITKTSPNLNASCVFIVGDANILNGKTLKYTGELLSGTSRAIIGYADADGGNRVTIAGNTNINSGTFERTITVDGTTYANKKVVVWLYSDVLTTGNIGDEIIYKNVMVSENGGEYEPCQEQIVTLDLKENFVGKLSDNIKDYLVTDKKKYWLVKNVNRGLISLTRTYETDTHMWFFFKKPTDSIDYGAYTTNGFSEVGIPDVTKPIYFNGAGNLDIYAIVYNKSKIETIPTIEELKKLVDGKYFYYQTATTETIELGELPEPIKTFEGVNNIQVLANLDTEIEVKYALDVKKYFDNKLASIQEQIL